MLLFLPDPYPDELFYSICARYNLLSCNKSNKDTLVDLFKSNTACAITDFPNRLESFYKGLHAGSKFTPERIIQEHTLFPLFRPFLPSNRVSVLIEAMKSSDKGGSIHTRIGTMASTVISPKYLRYCQECIYRDYNQYGEPYWHRIHQVPGIYMCPIHRSWLFESNISIVSSPNKQVFHVLSIDQEGRTINYIDDDQSTLIYHYLSEQAYWLLSHDIESSSLLSIREKYLSYLQRKGLVTYSGKIHQNDLLKEFTDFFGQKFLTDIHCEVKYSQDNWLSKIVRKPRVATHPLRHLLLMKFLDITPEEFFQDTHNIGPFGKGPWPCLNPASSHYHHNIIHKVNITMDSKKRVPVGTFNCSCGFSYSRRGPDQKVEDRYRIGRIKTFGSVWNKKLIHLALTEKIGLREMSRRLKVDPKTIKNRLEELRIEIVSKNVFLVLQNTEIKEEIRSEWLEILKNNPEKTRTELRKYAYSKFAWLYRNDYNWLFQHLPQSLKKVPVNKRVNWDSRDNELVQIIKTTVLKLMERTKPMRITKNAIGKEIGVSMLLQKHLDKLPKTKIILDNICETIEEFQIRRIRYVTQKLLENGENLNQWTIIRKAGLPATISETVIKEINKNVETERLLQ